MIDSRYLVGPGVREAMETAEDQPRSHEQYVHDPTTGLVLYSQTQGRAAVYVWTPEDGVKRLPFA